MVTCVCTSLRLVKRRCKKCTQSVFRDDFCIHERKQRCTKLIRLQFMLRHHTVSPLFNVMQRRLVVVNVVWIARCRVGVTAESDEYTTHR